MSADQAAALSPQALVFLADCKDHPEDDTPRFIFADWLEEQDDPRGEFVRLQCQLARLPSHDPYRSAGLSRERALLDRHRQTWVGPLRGPQWKCEFVRGLVRVSAPFLSAPSPKMSRHLSRHLPGPEAFAWVEGLEVTVRREMVSFLAQWPGLAHLRSLALRYSGLNDSAIAILASSAHLCELRNLDLTGNEIRTVPSLSPSLKGLRTLELTHNPLGDRGARSLAASELSDLTTLGLARTRLSDVGALLLAQSTTLGKRLRLNVYGNDLSPAAVAALEQRFGEEVYW